MPSGKHRVKKPPRRRVRGTEIGRYPQLRGEPPIGYGPVLRGLLNHEGQGLHSPLVKDQVQGFPQFLCLKPLELGYEQDVGQVFDPTI